MLLINSNGEIVSTVSDFTIQQYLKKGYTEYIEPAKKAQAKPKEEVKIEAKVESKVETKK